ncbi:MAG: LPS export ABC transporter permease LptG [Gammaproteobacteria bacterium]|nr:LPS export ABC transporter permease LptG [Gammaproteobacteria bacterium]
MKILDRYLGHSVLLSIALVLLVLLVLFSFVTFLAELGHVGKRDYGGMDVVEYVLLMVPRLAYQLMPMAVMIGTLVGLGMLANNGELTAMRAAGVTVTRVTAATLKVSLWLIVLAVLLGEIIAPKSEDQAYRLRDKALGYSSVLSSGGFWARDGRYYVHIGGLTSAGRLANIDIYEFDVEQKLSNMTHAGTAYFESGSWVLNEVVRSRLNGDVLSVEGLQQASWGALMSPKLLEVIDMRPDSMTVPDLYQHIGYLDRNGLNSLRYQKVLWGKVLMPLSMIVMVLLAVPFIFGSLRSVSLGHRIMVGVLVGLGYYMLNEIATYLGVVYEFNPMLGAMIPLTVFAAAAVYMLRKVM